MISDADSTYLRGLLERIDKPDAAAAVATLLATCSTVLQVVFYFSFMFFGLLDSGANYSFSWLSKLFLNALTQGVFSYSHIRSHMAIYQHFYPNNKSASKSGFVFREKLITSFASNLLIYISAPLSGQSQGLDVATNPLRK